MVTATDNVGRVTQVIGSTFDAEFPENHLPGNRSVTSAKLRGQWS